MQIENLPIGPEFPPVVIVEIGINHNGSLEEAYKLVDAAYKAGAQIIKHQTHVVDDEMSPEAKKVIPAHTKESIYEIMENCALNEADEIKLKAYVESKGMIFISTPFSRAAADRLQKMGVSAYKIGSGECNNYPLIEHIAQFGKPIILSTGMNDIASITKAVEIIEKHKIDYALLHCTNIYPTPNKLVRLGAMQQMQHAFPNAIIGLSDHTTTNYACLGAVALGASILERHFTDSKSRVGPDISCSMDPSDLTDLITGSRLIYESLGGTKEAAQEEQATIDFAFATVVTIKDINAGETLDKTNVWVKRPGTGEILAKDFENVLGKTTIKNIPTGTHLSYRDFV
ncbi:N-acetylneuraminate synthase family protein [Catenovulum sediminis]|uniref:N-acetylneuraminate synthase family protein n=1 Tax=Catenovulum sediminis TaxID=1740262 RepID=UPI002482552C|nr:N-acetylneuraminate synthase family protein [Catenovulum sediminis]